MKLTVFSFLLCFCAFSSIAQNKSYRIKGSVTDTMATYKMVDATVTVLNQKDSTLVKFTRTDATAKFDLGNLRSGKFILLISYPGYADYIEEFELNAVQPAKDFGDIPIILKSTLLEEVIIKGKVAAIKINGDTTEYNAGSYIIKPNSKVEDLLKQLPGIQVDRNGKITAHGQAVNKVLLDGEEFFSDDPTLVTRNIRGDMVDKVQVYDKKSDQATFTGIEDGIRDKTINIKTKADKKHGYFGKAEAGGGSNDFYEAEGMFNFFSGSRRFSAFGGSANTNRPEATGMSQTLVFGGDNGGGGPQGITTSTNGGIHYEDKFFDKKHGLNADYTIGSTQTDGKSSRQEEITLPQSTILNNNDQTSDNSTFKQGFRMQYTAKVDSLTDLRIMADGNLNKSQSNTHFNSLGRRDGILLNDGERDLNNESNGERFNVHATLSKKLKKPGRTLVFTARQTASKNEGTGFLSSVNNFYGNDGLLDSTQKIDQYKTSLSNNSSFNSSLNLTEKFSKALSLTFNYTLSVENSVSDKKSFNKSSSGNYDMLDKEFSNNYQLDELTNGAGLTLTYSKGKSSVNIGNRMSAVNFKQYDGYTDKTYKRNFLNWNPNANYSFRSGTSSNFNFSYTGNTSQPSIEQIQPIRVNTNPLYETIGNAALRPSYKSRIGLNYMSFKLLSERSIFMTASFGFVHNQITNNTVTDDAGKTTAQAINLKDRTPSDFNISVNSGKKIKSLGIQAGLEADISGNTSFNYSNGALNKTVSRNYRGNAAVSYNIQSLGFNLRGGPTYTTLSSSLQRDRNSQGWGASGETSINVDLPGKIVFSTRANYQYTGRTQIFDEEFDRLIVNADLRKKFFKSQSLSVNLKGYDLFNQNEGFSRTVNNNMITQSSFMTMRRYVMLTLSWDFNKMGVSSTKQ